MEKLSSSVILSGLFLVLTVTHIQCGIQDTFVQCRPEQIHLSYGGSTAEIVIMWATKGECTTMVKFSKVMWNLDQTAPGESRLFDGDSNKAGVQTVHIVKITGLEAGTTYFYKPLSNGIMPAVYFFTTPSVGTSGELSLMVISDLSSSSPVIPSLINELHTGKYAALLHAGNLAGNLSTLGGKNADTYFRELEPGLSYVPYMTAPGKWERENDDSFSQYVHRLSMPLTDWPIKLDQMWYSVDIGPVHLVSFSSEALIAAGGKYSNFEHDWLIKDLKSANENRDNVPWVVVFGHGPFYCTYEDPDLDCSSKTSAIRKWLEDILYHYGVDIMLTSYGGGFERTYPMFKGVQVSDNYTDPKGIIHITVGTATPWKAEYNFSEPAPHWIANRLPNDTRATYGRLRILNGSIAEYEQVAFADGEILDSFTINQSKHGEFSVKELPKNISAEIDKEILDAGGKPGILDIHELGEGETTGAKLANLLTGENKNKFIIAGSVATFIVLVLIILLLVRRMRRKRRITRRWEQMDINYGKKFYSKAPEKDEDNDFEIDIADDTESDRQLLTADD